VRAPPTPPAPRPGTKLAHPAIVPAARGAPKPRSRARGWGADAAPQRARSDGASRRYCNGSATSTLNCTYCDGLVYLAASAWAAPYIDDCGVCGGRNTDKGCDGRAPPGGGWDGILWAHAA
jgi:hypothetical protein